MSLFFLFGFIYTFIPPLSAGDINKPSLCPRAWSAPPAQVAKEIFDRQEQQVSDVKEDIKFTEFHNIKPATADDIQPVRRSPSVDFKTGTLGGEKVFLKKIASNIRRRELAVLQTLKEIGIPTLFRGVTKDKEDHLYIVSQHQEGTFVFLDEKVHPNYTAPLPFGLRMLMNYRLRPLKKMFVQYHIEPQDMQVLVSKEREIHIIDVEWYQFLGHEIDITYPVIALPHRPQKERLRRSSAEIKRSLNAFLRHISF